MFADLFTADQMVVFTLYCQLFIVPVDTQHMLILTVYVGVCRGFGDAKLQWAPIVVDNNNLTFYDLQTDCNLQLILIKDVIIIAITIRTQSNYVDLVIY